MRIYSEDIEMEFCVENCAMLIMKSIIRQMTEGIESPSQEKSVLTEKRKLTNN